MGIPSIGIYSTELYRQFDVDAINPRWLTGVAAANVKRSA